MCLSITKFNPKYQRTGKTERAEIFYDIYGKKRCLKNIYMSVKWPVGPGLRAETALLDLSSNQNHKPFEKKFATLAARAVFVTSFLLQKHLICDFLTRKNYPNSPDSQGGMKFATLISPLLKL